MATVSEVNHVLEINQAHSDNFILVIPKLPTAKFISSVFNELTKSVGYTTDTTGTTASNSVCPDINKNQIIREHNLDLTNYKLFLKSVTLPSVTIDTYSIGTQFATLKRASKIGFTDLSTNMMISENFLNYNIMLYWLYALHNPEQYNKISGHDMIQEYFTDIYLIITNNHREKVGEYKFLDAFPTSVPALPFTFENANKLFMDVTWSHSGMYPSNNFVLSYV